MALQFFPRGGSAHVARNLAANLPAAGWDVTLLSGSVAGEGDARAFYAGLDVRPVDMTAALEAPDPLRADPPLHASYEDRPGAPDRALWRMDDATLAHQVDAWARALEEAGAAQADVLHLHHLTPLNAAAPLAAPGVPVVGHLHGTELLMLEGLAGRAPAWHARLREWAAGCERLLVLTASHVERAVALLGVDPERCLPVPNGFDPALFHPRPRAPRDEVVLLYVGRFTAVKRVPLLIEAFARARPAFTRPARLVLVGGFPGEWEGEHPRETIARLGVPDVTLAGWHTHDALPGLLTAADVVVLPSVREQFGQVLVEGMACGLPAIAVDAFGPAEIVRDGETGWLVPPDDVAALAAALVAAVEDPAERARRGAAAREDALGRFAWPALAARVAALYERVARATILRP